MTIPTSHQTRLNDNWNAVLDAVRQSAVGAGRDADSVRVIGVTKYVDEEITAGLVQAGCTDLGENRPQSLWQKAESLAHCEHVQWHLIGHLQRNKVRRTLRHNPIIHSIDSRRLLLAVAEQFSEHATDPRDHQSAASQAGDSAANPIPVLLEVNISGEAAKTGMQPELIEAILNDLPEVGVQVIGLMAMAGWGSDASEARRQFAQTRELRDALESRTGAKLPELSMGMSGDFAEAIAEGATMVRIGRRLFEGVMDDGAGGRSSR